MMAAPSIPVGERYLLPNPPHNLRIQPHQIDGDKGDPRRILTADESFGHEAVADVRGPGSPPPVPAHCDANRRRDVGNSRAKVQHYCGPSLQLAGRTTSVVPGPQALYRARKSATPICRFIALGRCHAGLA